MRRSLSIPCIALFFASITAAIDAQERRLDSLGDPLPTGALTRLGSERLRHRAYVCGLALSPDGKHIASGGYDFKCHIWDAATGKQLHTVKTGYYVYAVAFSSDGKLFAHTFTEKNHYGGSIAVRNTITGREVLSITASTKTIYSIKYSPDGKWIAAGGEDSDVRIWNAKTGKLVHLLKSHLKGVRSIDFSHDGKRLVSAGDDGTVRVWDVAGGKLTLRINGEKPDHPVKSVKFAPDGKTVAFATSYAVRIWNLKADRLERQLEKASAPVAYSPDGKQIAARGEGYSFNLFRTATGELMRTFVGHGSYLYDFAFSPNGQRLYSASADGTVRFWNVKNGEEIRPYEGHQYDVLAAAVSPDGTRIATAGGDNTVRIWGAASGRQLRWWQVKPGRFYYGHNMGASGPTKIVFTPDGKKVATAGRTGVQLFDSENGTLTQLHNDWGYTVCFSPDGQLIAYGDYERGKIRICNADTKQKLRLLQVEGAPRDLQFSVDGKMLFAATCGERRNPRGQMEAWFAFDVETGKLRWKAERTKGAGTMGFVLTPDGRSMISFNGAKITWHDAKSGKETRVIDFNGSPFSWVTQVPLAISPDGRLLAVHTSLIDITTGKTAHRLVGHGENGVNGVTFTPDGKRLVSASKDNTAVIWDLAPSRLLRLADADNVPQKHLDVLWNALGDQDASAAYRAVWTLVMAPKHAVRLFQDRLRPVYNTNPKEIAKLIAQFNSEIMAKRQFAFNQLKQMGSAIEESLQLALKEKRTLEERRRIEQLLSLIRTQPISEENLRFDRALQALELIGTKQVDSILEKLARGPRTTYSVLVERALVRLAKRRKELPLVAERPAAPEQEKIVLPKLRTFLGHQKEITRLAFTPDGKKLLSISADQTLRRWMWNEDQPKPVVFPALTPLDALAVAPDGKHAIVGGPDGNVRLIGLTKEAIVKKWKAHDAPVTAATFMGARIFATGDDNGTIRLWNLTGDKPMKTMAKEYGRVTSLASVGAGASLLAGYMNKATNNINGVKLLTYSPDHILEWNLETGKSRTAFPKKAGFFDISPGGRTIAAIHSDWEISVNNRVAMAMSWKLILADVKSQEVQQMRVAQGSLVAYSPDARFLLSGPGVSAFRNPLHNANGVGTKALLVLIEVATGQDVVTLPTANVSAAAYSPDGNYIACGTSDGEIHIFSVVPQLRPNEARPFKLDEKGLQELRTMLMSNDAGAAYRAYWRLHATPEKATAMLQKTMRLPGPDDKKIQQLITALDAERLKDRELAARKLQGLGALAQPALLKVLGETRSLAIRQPIVKLLATPEMSRYPQSAGRLRVVALLAAIGTDEARAVLRGMAEGIPIAPQTQAAREVLERWKAEGK